MKKRHLIIGAVLILFGIFLDQLIKFIVRAHLELDEQINFIKHFIVWTHVENNGAAWSSFSGQQILLIVISIIILAYFLYLYKDLNYTKKTLFSISLTMVISGTIGNLIDRIAFRSVTDYIQVILFGWDGFPVFNLADILLVVGFILFIIDLIFVESLDNNSISSLENRTINYVTDDLQISNKEIKDEVENNIEEDANGQL